MTKEHVGAVVVVEDARAVGIFTRRDAIERVVLQRKPLGKTEISSVMTSPVEVFSKDTDLSEAIRTMASRPFNHIPVVDADEKVVGLATTKPVMKQAIERLSNELVSLEAFFTADGVGG
jgi:CBS domain-containing protein